MASWTINVQKDRDDGVFVALPDGPHEPTVSDVSVETMVNWGVKHVWPTSLVEVITDAELL